MNSATQLPQISTDPLKILVVGATGGTGLAVVQQLLQDGHTVTAFSRHASSKFAATDRLTTVDGNVMQPADIDDAVKGQDAVIVVLGISENPIRVRLFGTARTPSDVRSTGTKNVIDAMRKHDVSRLIVQSSFGVGETRELLGFTDQLIFTLLLKPQIADTEVQELAVRNSGIDWVLVQPVHLTDSHDSTMPYVSTQGKTRLTKVARTSVAQILAVAVREPDFIGKTVAVSG